MTFRVTAPRMAPILPNGQTQDPPEIAQPVTAPLVVKSQDGKDTFTFQNVKGSCFKGQQEQVSRALLCYQDHLEVFANGITDPTNTKVQEEPLTIRYLSTATFETELREVGYTTETIERLKKDRALGLYTNASTCPNTLWLVVDSWYKPGTPVDLYSTAFHELGHAIDDYGHYSNPDEPRQGWLTIKHKDVFQRHWEQGYKRIGYPDASATAAEFNRQFDYIRTRSAPPPIQDAKSFDYLIKNGDKLILIAQQFNCNVDEILTLNPVIANPNRIRAGQTIKIPQKNPPATSDQLFWNLAQVSIARMERRLSHSFLTSYMATAYQGTSFDVDRVLKENLAEGFEGLGDPTTRGNFSNIDPHFAEALEKYLHFGKHGLTRVQAEEQLITALKMDWPLFPYTVQDGDTLSQICVDFGFGKRIKEVAELNGIENANKIKPGQIIHFPK